MRSLLSFKATLFITLVALFAPGAHSLTYVSGSLTDANPVNGNGVSTPSGLSNIQYSNGSPSGYYGQIDIADVDASPDWVYDLGSTTAISSVSFWSYENTSAFSQMPSGNISIYCANSSSGPWVLIGAATRSMIRDNVDLPDSTATNGEGFRIPCDGSSGRYIRIMVVTPGSVGGLDNHWIIRRVEENSDLVIHSFYNNSNGSSNLNDLPRTPYNAVDGTTSTIWNPQATDMRLVLDLGAANRRFQKITMIPGIFEGSYLPQKGEVRISSTDDPDDMDKVVAVFEIDYNNEDTDNAVITLPQPVQARFVEVHWERLRNLTRRDSRFAEIQVDTVSAKPVGIDITQASIPASRRVTPNDGIDDTAKLQAAINIYKYVYLPQGTYNITNDIYMPSDSRLYGDGVNRTILSLATTGSTAIRIEASDNVMLDHFCIDRTLDNATEAAIYAYRYLGDSPMNLEFESLKINNNRSRDGAIVIAFAMNVGLTDCSVQDAQRQIFESDGQWYVYGSGLRVVSSTNIYLDGNSVTESRDLISSLGSPHGAGFYQSGGIETAGSKDAVVTDNVIKVNGNGIDIGGCERAWVEENWVENIHQTGVKLVNGTSYSHVLSNTIKKCGITAAWFGCGSAPGYAMVHHNVFDGNDIFETGQGIGGQGFWSGLAWAPAGVCLSSAPLSELRCEYNTVSNNNLYLNSFIRTPLSIHSVYVDTASFAPFETTTFNNNLCTIKSACDRNWWVWY